MVDLPHDLASRPFACFLLVAVLTCGGCVQTAMTPAQQLESGTTVASVSLDEPGILYFPRLNAQLTYGLGGGDLTTNVSYPSLAGGPGVGLTGRYYLTPRATGEVQFQVGRLLDGQPTGLVLMGIQEVPVGEDTWYLGGQAGVISGEAALSDVSGANDNRATAPVVGGSVGYGPVDLGSDWWMQVELEANVPLGNLSGEEPDVPFPATRLSIGVFRLFR